jgi:quercetin dioxygenase-like cupin family protein
MTAMGVTADSLDLSSLLGVEGAGAVYTAQGDFCFQPLGCQPGMKPFVRRATLARSQWALGSLFCWLATSADTAGRLAVAEIALSPVSEMPAHVHTREDELVVVLEGIAKVGVGRETLLLEAGQSVLLPRAVRHHCGFQSGGGKVLTAWSPGGIEDYYAEFARPARALRRPTALEDPVDLGAIVARITEVGARYGIWYPPA